ncbi:MAG: histidine kinase, partial [Candidatus Thiodiazotropha sp. 6PLUC10]
ILFSRTAVKDSNDEISHIICIAKDMTGYVREMDVTSSTSQGV